MDPILEPLRVALADVKPKFPHIPLYSTVTGERVEGIAYGADYWPQNVRQSVEFAAAIYALLADGYNTFIEVGPHPVLATSMKDCIKVAGKECRLIHTLRRNQPEWSNIERSIMSVYAEGCDIDWKVLNDFGNFIPLPNYAWQRERFWLENDRAVQDRIAPIQHPMLGIQEAPGTPVWRNDFDHEPMSYLRDHVVTGMPILPAAGYVESLLELAALQYPEHPGFTVRDLEIRAPMILSAERGLDCVTSYDPFSQLATIRGLENGKLGTGQIHVLAKIGGMPRFQREIQDLPALRDRCVHVEDISAFYRSLDQMGLSYGHAFQTVRELRLNEARDQVLAHIEIQPELIDSLTQYKLHPTLLDACFQTLTAMLGDSENMYLPTGFSELCLYTDRVPATIWCLGEKTQHDAQHIDCDLTLMDDQGLVIATLRAMRSTAASKRERRDRFGDKIKRQVLTYQWSYAESQSEPKRLGYWLVVGASCPLFNDVVNRLEHYGATVAGKVAFAESRNQDGDVFVVQKGSIDDANAVLDSCGELDGVVFLDGLLARYDSLDPTGEQALMEITAFAKAMDQRKSTTKPRAYVVTQSAFSTSEHDGVVQPAQSALNGFVRVAFNELDGLQFSSIDLPSKCNDDTIDSLALELLCDSIHDEVAIRGTMRLTSELNVSPIISEDRIEYAHLDDEHPIQVRALRPDMESIGTARIIAMPAKPVLDDMVHMRIEASIVPSNLLLDPAADTIDQPWVEFVGEVLSVGPGVSDLTSGMRICGFAPADIASHAIVSRGSLYVTEIDDAVDATLLVSALGMATKAERVAECLDLQVGEKALLEWSPLSLAIADALRRRGVPVSFLANEPEGIASSELSGSKVYSRCPVGIAAAVQAQTHGIGFSALVAGMHEWSGHLDFHAIKHGATIVDTDDMAKPILLPSTIGAVVRTDCRNLFQKRAKLERALRVAVGLIQTREIAGSPVLEVSVSDLAWQKLPLADTSSTIVITFETRGKDLPVVQRDQLAFARNGTYLVTGGFGGFGQKTAEWLATNGAGSIVLTGRTGADSVQRKAFVKHLESMGVQVHAAACDTSSLSQLQELFGVIHATMPPLRGVFHSGALILDQPIVEIDSDTLGKVMQSKALGAWNLHLLTCNLQLDHFVLYSSIANLVGNSRQAAYSAANGFLNGLASMRKAMGLPGTSVNWGAISDVGVVAQDEKLEQFLRYTGLRGISSKEGLDVLGIGLVRQLDQLGITMITSWADWARFETRGAKSPRFASLIASDSEVKDHSIRDALIEELSQLENAEQVELLGGLIIEVIASVLKSDPSSIPLDCSINQLGVDSLMATEIQLLFDSKLGLTISILELIGEATVRSIATQSLKTLMGDANKPLASMAAL